MFYKDEIMEELVQQICVSLKTACEYASGDDYKRMNAPLIKQLQTIAISEIEDHWNRKLSQEEICKVNCLVIKEIDTLSL